jgi:predicted O-methyltransferase YrrM
MNRFWTRFVKPIIETTAPRRMMEIGADSGWNTQRLLDYCRETGCRLEIVDPAPRPALFEVLARFGGQDYVHHPLKSLDAIPAIAPVDLVLLDGDHNWYTVYNELQAIFRTASEAGAVPPIVLFHDVAWPYARRDMYYAPLDLAPADRHPYAYRGMVQGQSELSEIGFNGILANALHEGGPRNGVLTAIEDFQAGIGIAMSFHRLPFFNGLGILVPERRSTPTLKAVIESFFSAESLLETCVELEEHALRARTELAAHQIRLTQRTEALNRAKSLIDSLREELKSLKSDDRS